METSDYRVIGMMSGTSMDGMDLVFCHFSKRSDSWNYSIEKSVTYPYPKEWTSRLTDAWRLEASEFLQLHLAYGRFIGEQVNRFMKEHKIAAHLVASHGHTIFHQPEKGFTFQLGEGSSIAVNCGITTVSDFRTMDVALGGQGAPLVPIGDELLFGSYASCLNLGGFANISHRNEGKRIAFDLCPSNIVLNSLAMQVGMEYDEDGKLGRKGTIHSEVVNELDQLAFYNQSGPKSLGKEWVDSVFMPVLMKYSLGLEDLMACVYEHVSRQIGSYADRCRLPDILVTGGGALNNYLFEKIDAHTNARLILPDMQIVKFKEALIFAFLGLLRYLNEINCLASVTGAIRDSSTGAVHLG